MPAYKTICLGEFLALLDSLRGRAVLLSFMTRTRPELVGVQGGRDGRFRGKRVFKRSAVCATLNFDYYKARLKAEARRVAKGEPNGGRDWREIFRDIDAQGESYVFQHSDIAGQCNEKKPRKWGRRLRGTCGEHLPLVTHVNKQGEANLYVEVQVNRTIRKPGYEWEDGTPLSALEASELRRHLRPPRDELVILRDYCITNVTHVHVDGLRYRIVHKPGELESMAELAAAA